MNFPDWLKQKSATYFNLEDFEVIQKAFSYLSNNGLKFSNLSQFFVSVCKELVNQSSNTGETDLVESLKSQLEESQTQYQSTLQKLEESNALITSLSAEKLNLYQGLVSMTEKHDEQLSLYTALNEEYQKLVSNLEDTKVETTSKLSSSVLFTAAQKEVLEATLDEYNSSNQAGKKYTKIDDVVHGCLKLVIEQQLQWFSYPVKK